MHVGSVTQELPHDFWAQWELFFLRMKLFFPNPPFVKTVLFPITIFPAVFQNRIEKSIA